MSVDIYIRSLTSCPLVHIPTSSAESTAGDDRAEQAAERMKDIQRIQEDKWCIEYLKTYYVPAVCEGMCRAPSYQELCDDHIISHR